MDEINIRIIKLMVKLEHNKTSFAKELQVSLPLITHISTGRNKPGLDLIQKILQRFDKVDPDWLINGSGDMYRVSPEKPDYSILYSKIDEIKYRLLEQEKVNKTINSYHKILRDEVKHLEEMEGIIKHSTESIKNILEDLDKIKVDLLSK